AEDLLVEALLDDARDLVALGRQRRALAQLGERHLREQPPRGHALLRRSRREPGQPVARALAVGLGQQLVEVAETEAAAVDAQRESHRPRILRVGPSACKEASRTRRGSTVTRSWRQQEAPRLAVQLALADDLAGVVQALRDLEHPARAGGDDRVE